MEQNDKKMIEFIVTMDSAYKLLEKGTISPDEYKKFLDEMYDKYRIDDTRIIYQAKLEMFMDRRE